MKRAPHSLELLQQEKGLISLRGPDAGLGIRRLGSGSYEVRYDFFAYPVAERIEEAAALHYDPSFTPEERSFDPVRDQEGLLRLGDGEYEISVDRANGTLSLSRGELLLHGGAIGSSDTVLPRFPLRVHGRSPDQVRGTFNFALAPEDQFFGLGDKGGDIDRRNRRFLMHNRDALGYRGSFADPLYKSIPFVMKWNPKNRSWIGLAVAAPDVISADFGVESQYYYSFSLRNGPFRYLLFAGETYREVLDKYTAATGRPALPPAFTFGFLGSSMDYSEPDDAEDRILAYLKRIEEEGIPCEGIYLSSGYYKAENGHRHTFVWNDKKFPDARAFLEGLRARGYHIALNIKPGILIDHPRYSEYAAAGSLVGDGEGKPYTEFYWGENASFWEFGTPAGRERWAEELDREILSKGADGIWNDNNEYEIEDSTVPAYSSRSTYALRMSKVSYDAALRRDPERRPWIVSRSGGIGIQRYARTWSGDNASTYESLRFNLLQGSSLGLSGIPFFGHDVGGFFGDRPDAGQFLRWCQAAVFQPRFVIHSWNSDAAPTELWSYPTILTSLKALVGQHYEFMPYTYSEAYRAHRSGLPIQRPLCLEFPDDDIPSDTPAYLYGDAILVLPGTEAEERAVAIKLPAGEWFDPDRRRFIEGGGIESFDLAEDHVRYLIRSGAIIPRTEDTSRGCDRGWYPGLILDLYPGRDEYEYQLFEDDGISSLDLGRYRTVQLSLAPLGEGCWKFRCRISSTTAWAPEDAERTVTLGLPPGYRFDGAEGRLTAAFGPEPSFTYTILKEE